MTVNWMPRNRWSYELDFEDWIQDETGIENWHYPIPAKLVDGSDLSPMWFLQMAQGAFDAKHFAVEDLFLRKAALRRSWYAMDRLALLRYEMGHFEESMRWNQRLLSHLAENEKKLNQLVPQMDKREFKRVLKDARNNILHLKKKGIDSDKENPQDLGNGYFASLYQYCLTCGKRKMVTAPMDQCDDTVHVVSHNFGQD